MSATVRSRRDNAVGCIGQISKLSNHGTLGAGLNGGDESCQHCMTDSPNPAPVTVTLRCLAASVNSGKRAKVVKMREKREETKHMAEKNAFG